MSVRKVFGTRGNGTVGNIWLMTRDERWRGLEGTWDRLKWARLQKFATAEEAAPRVGEKPGTYRAYERPPTSSKHISLDPQRAFHFAKRFGVRWEWLLLGEGPPWLDPDVDRDRILSAYDNAPQERRAAVADAIEKLLKTG